MTPTSCLANHAYAANRCMRCGEPQTEEMRSAMNAVITAAKAYSDCMAEFESDPGCCGEHLNALWTGRHRLKKAEVA